MKKIEEFGNSSSIHGIKYVLILNNSKATRIFWLLSILLSICGFFYYVHSAYYKLTFDPETAMKTNDRISSEFPAPAITICSNLFTKDNLVNLTQIYEKSWNKSSKLTISSTECKYLAANQQWCGTDPSTLLMCSPKVVNSIDVVKFIEKSSYVRNETFIECLNPKEQCDKIYSRVFTDYGICFTRNSLSFSAIFNTKIIHNDFKCYKILNQENHEETSDWSPEIGFEANQHYPKRALKGEYYYTFPRYWNRDKSNMCGSSNFRIYLHKPNEVMTPSHLIEYFDLGENLELKVNLKSHKTDRALQNFPPEKRKCYFEGEKQLKFFKSYTKALCEWECLANATLKRCKCSKFSHPRDISTPICNFTSLLSCVVEVDSANCECFSPCIDIEYTYKLMRSQYKTGPSATNMAYLHVSIENEAVIEIENIVSYKLQNFISDLGGLLGLFMGCSLLSIMEIFYFLANGSSSMFSKCKAQKSPQVWATKSTSKESTLNIQQINTDVLSALNILAGSGKEYDKKFRVINERIDEVLKEIHEIQAKVKS